MTSAAEKRETAFAIRNPDGTWVAKDTSTGPMASGGYPYPVNQLARATFWPTRSSAESYRRHFADLRKASVREVSHD
jgi:hypothetical protein